MIFKCNRSKKRFPKFFWSDSEEIEIVDKYTYLEVNLHSNSNMSETCNHFFNKALVAENQLFNVFYRSKIKTLDSRLSLFDT